jgi:hypothetical protein
MESPGDLGGPHPLADQAEDLEFTLGS